MSARTVTVLTHRRVKDTTGAVRELIGAARRAGVTLRFTEDEASKHGLSDAEGVVVGDLSPDVELCIVLGGDGTILTALREYAGTGVPVFAVNFGEVGFLATIDPTGWWTTSRGRSRATSRRSSCPRSPSGGPRASGRR